MGEYTKKSVVAQKRATVREGSGLDYHSGKLLFCIFITSLW